jgi:diphthamide synthase (EF-2-diphthine--ammonia ligase)
VFPLWGQDTAALAREFLDAGFEAMLVCVDPRALDPAFCGRRYDERLLAELPPGVDPCGENGEFHTFVHAGPVFDAPIEVVPGAVVMREGFAFQDLLSPQAAGSRRRNFSQIPRSSDK